MNKSIFHLLVLFACVSFMSCASVASQTKTSASRIVRIEGRILGRNGNPITDREVRICERDIVGRAVEIGCPGMDGSFHFRLRNPQNYVTVDAEGYVSKTFRKGQFKTDRNNLKIRLKPAPCTLKSGDEIHGFVWCYYSPHVRSAAKDALVREFDRKGNVVASTVAESGRFSMKIVNPGDKLEFSVEGHQTYTTTVEISDYEIDIEY